MATCVLKALPGKLDIKRHSPSILYVWSHYLWFLPYSGKLNLKKTLFQKMHHSVMSYLLGKGWLTSWLSCKWCFLGVSSLSHMVSWVRFAISVWIPDLCLPYFGKPKIDYIQKCIILWCHTCWVRADWPLGSLVSDFFVGFRHFPKWCPGSDLLLVYGFLIFAFLILENQK